MYVIREVIEYLLVVKQFVVTWLWLVTAMSWTRKLWILQVILRRWILTFEDLLLLGGITLLEDPILPYGEGDDYFVGLRLLIIAMYFGVVLLFWCCVAMMRCNLNRPLFFWMTLLLFFYVMDWIWPHPEGGRYWMMILWMDDDFQVVEI